MKKRIVYALICAGALAGGLLIYCFFRSGTHIHRLLALCGIRLRQIKLEDNPANNILRYYLSDYLWLLSLQFGMLAVLLPKKVYPVLAGTLCFAVLFEIGQWLKIISGTGDFLDIFAYILAGISTYIIFTLIEKEK